MATCCLLGRNRGLLATVGLVGTLALVTSLAGFLVAVGVVLAVLAPAAAVCRGTRRQWQRTARAAIVTVQVTREKVAEVLAGVAPQTRCRASAALFPVSPGVAGFVYRHFVGLAVGLGALALVLGFVLVRTLTA